MNVRFFQCLHQSHAPYTYYIITVSVGMFTGDRNKMSGEDSSVEETVYRHVFRLSGGSGSTNGPNTTLSPPQDPPPTGFKASHQFLPVHDSYQTCAQCELSTNTCLFRTRLAEVAWYTNQDVWLPLLSDKEVLGFKWCLWPLITNCLFLYKLLQYSFVILWENWHVRFGV